MKLVTRKISCWLQRMTFCTHTAYIQAHTHTRMYIHTHVYVHVCVYI